MYDRDEEQRDEFIAKRATVRSAELRAKLAAGDAQEVAHVDEQIGSMLFTEGSGFTWAQLIEREAQGQSEFQRLMNAAIAAIAECRAMKDVEDAAADAADSAAYARHEQMKADRDAVVQHMYRSVFPMYH